MTTAQFSEDGLGRIERHFGEYILSGKIAGCSMILWSGGEECFTSFQGVQDLENPYPVNRETIFRIYSMTKPVASVALMIPDCRLAFWASSFGAAFRRTRRMERQHGRHRVRRTHGRGVPPPHRRTAGAPSRDTGWEPAHQKSGPKPAWRRC